MKLKKMTDEQIQLDVEKLNGFLCAVEAINAAANTGLDYTFIRLPDKHTLLKSVESHIAAIHPDTVLANWHISLDQVSENQLAASINEWFFRFGKAATLNDALDALPTGFMDILKQLVYTPNIYRVTMIPPVWYATSWETFVFDSKNGYFLLEFNFDT